MPVKQPSVTLVQHSSIHSGSTISGLMVAKALLRADWKVHVVFGFQGDFESIFQEAGCSTEVIPHKNWIRNASWFRFPRHWFAEFRQAKLFGAMLKQRQPDFIYINSMVSLAAAIGARMAGIPTIWHLRELYGDDGGEMAIPECLGKSTVRRFINHYANGIICNSQSVVDNVLGSKIDKVHIIPNAVEDHFFKKLDPVLTRKTLGLPQPSTIIGIPGTLRPAKGHAFFFQAASKLLERFPDCCFAITGDLNSDYADEVIKQAEQYGVRDHCHFLDKVTQMPDFYAACDLICVPSVSESFGRTVVEAFACKRPVIATAVGGMKETIRDNHNGRLVQYGDVEGLTEILMDLLAHPAARNQLEEAGHQSVLLRYTEDVYAKSILKAVHSTLPRG